MEQEMFPSFEPEELLALMKEHAKVYSGGEELRVEYTDDTPHITEDAVVKMNPAEAWKVKEKLGLTEKQAVRLLLDTLSHEVEHYKQSELDAKGRFVEEYPHWPKIAGAVHNIVEDRYIDMKRIKQFEGLMRPFDWATESKTPEIEIPEDDPVEAMIRCLVLTARGELGLDRDLESDFLEEFVEDVVIPELESLPEADAQWKRLEISHTIAATIVDIAEDQKPEELEFLEDLLDDIMDDLIEEVENMEPDNMEEVEEKVEERKADMESEPGDVDGEAEETESEEEEGGEVEEDTEVRETEEEDSDSSSGESSQEEEKKKKQQEESEEDDQYEVTTEEDMEDTEVETTGSGPDFEPDDDEMESWKNTDPDKVTLGGSGEGFQIEGLRQKQDKSRELGEEVIEVLEDLNNEQEVREVNTTKGPELDVKKAIRHVAGDPSEQKVFKKEIPLEDDDRVIGVTLDGSGSMQGDNKIGNALKAVGAVGKAAQKVGDDFTANMFRTLTGEEMNEALDDDESPCITEEITGLNEEFDMDHLERVDADGRDPMALGLKELAEEMQEAEAEEEMILAITDGNPSITIDGDMGHGGSAYRPAVDEAKEEIQELRERGFKIRGIAVGNDPVDSVMDKMFGEDQWFRFTGDELAQKLLTIYRNNVN